MLISQINQAWAGHPGMLFEGVGNEGKFVMGDTCGGASAASQTGWSYDLATEVVKGPGGCLDNRTIKLPATFGQYAVIARFPTTRVCLTVSTPGRTVPLPPPPLPRDEIILSIVAATSRSSKMPPPLPPFSDF